MKLDSTMSAMNYFEFWPDTKEMILKQIGSNEKSLEEDIKIINDWLITQKHLPEIPNEKFIRAFLVLNKCRIERTKEKIDMYYTIRSVIPEIFANSNPKNRGIQLIMEQVYMIPLPKPTEQHYRVTLIKIKTPEPDKIDFYQFFAHSYNLAEIRIQEDICSGEIFIYDLAGCSLGLVSKLTPSIISKTNTIYEKVYSSPLKGVHFINSPPIVQNIVGVLKSVLKPKLSERVHVHKGSDSLKQFFDPRILPEDYCGQEKSLSELQELLKLKLIEYQARFDELDKLHVNENLRPAKLENDEILGFHGNFKKLSLD